MFDPRDFSVRVGSVEISDLMEIEPTFGTTVSPVSSPQGFVDHQVKIEATTVRVKFKAAPHAAVLAQLGDYKRNDSAVTVSIVTPEYTATVTGARLSDYPKRQASVADLGEYEVELTGRSEGPRYV